MQLVSTKPPPPGSAGAGLVEFKYSAGPTGINAVARCSKHRKKHRQKESFSEICVIQKELYENQLRPQIAFHAEDRSYR
tara:strand:- start:273 stop:509 length:237 start_codon:yes stop_codon:yes gene_type:complete